MIETKNENERITIHTIVASTWSARYEKWRVELALEDHPKRVCWLSNTQYSYLTSAFSHTKSGYSDRQATVIGEFDPIKGYFIRCTAHRHPPKPAKVHTPLVEPTQVDDALRD